MSVVIIQDSPARLLIWMNCVFPSFLLADTLNSLSVRSNADKSKNHINAKSVFMIHSINIVFYRF